MTKITKDLNKGDRVYVSRMSRSFSSDTQYIMATVQKVTPTGLVHVLTDSGREVKFNQACGEIGGDKYYGLRLEMATEEIVKRIAARAADLACRHALRDFTKAVEAMSVGDLMQASAVVERLETLQKRLDEAKAKVAGIMQNACN
jgi:hypothetical protein